MLAEAFCTLSRASNLAMELCPTHRLWSRGNIYMEKFRRTWTVPWSLGFSPGLAVGGWMLHPCCLLSVLPLRSSVLSPRMQLGETPCLSELPRRWTHESVHCFRWRAVLCGLETWLSSNSRAFVPSAAVVTDHSKLHCRESCVDLLAAKTNLPRPTFLLKETKFPKHAG